MKTIILHGILEKYFCKKFECKLKNAKDIFKSLYCNFPDYEKKINNLKKHCHGIAVVIDDQFVFNSEIDDFENKLMNASKIELIPCVVFSAFLGITAALIFKFVLVLAVSVGISMLITHLMKSGDPKQVKTASYIFGNKENTELRNFPIALNYGRLKLGSSVVSGLVYNFDIDFLKNESTLAIAFSEKSSGLINQAV